MPKIISCLAYFLAVFAHAGAGVGGMRLHVLASSTSAITRMLSSTAERVGAREDRLQHAVALVAGRLVGAGAVEPPDGRRRHAVGDDLGLAPELCRRLGAVEPDVLSLVGHEFGPLDITMHPRRDVGREVLAGCGRWERCQRAISRPLLGCECCVNRARTIASRSCGLPCWHAPSHDPDHRRDPGTGRRRLRWPVGARVGGHGARRLHRQPRHHVLATDRGGVAPRRSDRGARTGWPRACRVPGPGDADRADAPQHLSRWRARAARVHPRSRLPHQPPRVRVLHPRCPGAPERLRQPRAAGSRCRA